LSDWAAVWEEHYEPLTLPLNQTLISSLQLKKATSVLEVACGTGAGSSICNYQKPKHVKLTAVDLAPGMVEKAKKKIDDPAVQVLVADAENLPFANEEFDRYYASYCLHLVNDPDKMLVESARVLKSGGIAAFSVWGRRENFNLMTFLHEVAQSVGVSLNTPGAGPARTPFHLGADIDTLRQRVIKAGFSHAIGFYQNHPTTSFNAAEIADRSLAFPIIYATYQNLPETSRNELRTKAIQFLEDNFKAGKTLNGEALIIVAVK